MMRAGYLVVAAVCYAAFLASFIYLVGFIAAAPQWPTSVDSGMSAPPLAAAVIDFALIGLFGLQHSVMARRGFKRWFTRFVPSGLERSLYCLATALVLAVMFRFWHPIDMVVWNAGTSLGVEALWGLFALGIAVVFISTWLINHFELFGLSQAWYAMHGKEHPGGQFRTPMFYKLVRHPIYTGFIIALWATPYMTLGHFILALGLTTYILIGIRYEERDLVTRFGDTYQEYSRKVTMIVPLPRWK